MNIFVSFDVMLLFGIYSLFWQDVALLTDGRFSGGSHGYVVGHICPEAQVHFLFLHLVLLSIIDWNSLLLQ